MKKLLVTVVVAALGGLVTAGGLFLGSKLGSHSSTTLPSELASQTPLQPLASPSSTSNTAILAPQANQTRSLSLARLSTTSHTAKLSDSAIEKMAAACRFDQSMYPNTGMSFEIKSFPSQSMNQERLYGLILPPGYQEHPHQYYPTIFLLHGGHGDAERWESCSAVTAVLDKLYKSKKLPPAIVITPDGNDLRGSSSQWDPQYFNGSHGQVDTLIGSELVQVVKARYRVQNNPQFWAMGGLSSGGWGAFNIGLRHLNNFHILFSLSGYFTDASGSKNSPASFVQTLPTSQRQALKAYLNAGTADKEFLTSTEQFAQILNKLHITYVLEVPPGGHGTRGLNSGWYYWHKHLADALTYIGEQWKPLQKSDRT